MFQGKQLNCRKNDLRNGHTLTVTAHACPIFRAVRITQCALPQLRNDLQISYFPTNLIDITPEPCEDRSTSSLSVTIMVSPCLLRLSVLTTSISLAISLHVSKDDRRHNLGARAPPSILPSPSQDVAHTLLPDFLPDSAKTDTMIGEDVHVSCDSLYGFALQRTSCLNVLTLCPSGTKIESWAYPSDIPPGQTVDEVLPIKLFSSECTLTAFMGARQR